VKDKKTPWICRLLGHAWAVRTGSILVSGEGSGDLICTSCSATAWSVTL
jgi:hypothetical protein